MRASGIDISKWQESFESQGNIDFIIQKVSEGLAKDDLYNELLPSVKTIERRGGYHYFRTEVDPILQADFFFNAQAGQGFKELVMDYEAKNNVLDAQGEENLWRFYQELLELTDKPISLYTTEYTLRDKLLIYNDRWLGVPFHVARYKPSLNPQTDTPLFLDIPGLNWIRWQWEADGNGKGAEYGVGSEDIDLNVFNGTVEELDDWLGITDPPPADCDELVAEAVKRAQAECRAQIAVLDSAHEKELAEIESAHQAEIIELQKAHALMMEAAIIKSNNEGLQNLIKPFLK